MLYGVPAVQIAFSAPFLRGAIFGMLVAAFLWLERLPRSEASAAAALAGCALGLGFVLAPLPDGKGPWIDYRDWSLSPSTARAETFLWDHRYGPLNWPRSGRVMLRVRARQAAYWKTENLDDFDGFRWGARVGSSHGAAAEPAPRPEWRADGPGRGRQPRHQRLRGSGGDLHLDRPPRFPCPAGSSGTFRVAKDLVRGDAYRAQVYVPRPPTAAAARAPGSTTTPTSRTLSPSRCPTRSAGVPSPTTASTVDGADVIFAFFGSHGERPRRAPTRASRCPSAPR